MTQDLETLARRASVPYYEDAFPGHDRFHARRVRDLSNRLADEWEESVDRAVLSAAAWLHDVGRPRERSGAIDDHGGWAADELGTLVETDAVAADRIDAVEHCLRTHSIRSSSPEPQTPAAQLLFDADKLEAAGAVGIVRMACIVGERSGRAGERYAELADESSPGVDSADDPAIALLREWVRERLDALYTPPGRRLGASRWRFVEAFFEQFERETGADADR